MSAPPGELGPDPAPGTSAPCGRGWRPRRLNILQERYFFTTCSDVNMLKKLKSAERLFLLIKKEFPLAISSVRKGKIFNEMQRLINDPGSWLNAISLWKKLLELDAKKEKLSQKDANLLKRKVGENEIIIAKKLKIEQLQKIEENRECQMEKQIEEETLEQRDFITKGEKFQEEEFQNDIEKATITHNQSSLTFRVSCRCSGTVGKAFSAQEVGKVIGIALMKQFGWKADLRNPNLEIFVHLNDIYSVVGIPVFRVPLASRTYIKTAGLRSTIAWAMASLAEIKAGAFVLDPMCGLGTILLEAAKECVDIIISDIPFGKKFKLGKDIKSILQEMERVLRVGGTIVLLLSEDHHRRLKDCEESSIPLNSKNSYTDEPGIKRCLNLEETTGLSETELSSFEASNQECLEKMSPFGSLVPVECYKVSLGKTDAFIYKYKKSHSSAL
uniref:THUMP domain-containing protein n=1 Tax=Propithecus coquereli TaxID=379532 RepID=A0A2K6GYM4_PROCO